jgi:hypothetical protein
MTDKTTTKLTREQIDFMLRHHEAIERARELHIRGNQEASDQMIDDIYHSDEYRHLFGDMGWDDALDYYEDTPEFDWSLRKAISEQLQEEFQSGLISMPDASPSDEKPTGSSLDDIWKELGLDDEPLLTIFAGNTYISLKPKKALTESKALPTVPHLEGES